MTDVILGSGAYRYEVIDQWAKLPPGREFNADVAAVAVDAQAVDSRGDIDVGEVSFCRLRS